MNDFSFKNNTFCYGLPIAIGNRTFCGLTERWTSRFNHRALLAMTITPILIYWLILFLTAKEVFKALHFIWQWQKEMTRESQKTEAILLKYFEKRHPNDKGNEERARNIMESWAETIDSDADLKYAYLEGFKELFADTPKHDTNFFVEEWRSFFTTLKQSNRTGKLFILKSYFSFIIFVLIKYFWDAIDLTLDIFIFYRLERGEVLDGVIYRNRHANNAIYAFAILGCLIKILIWKSYTLLVEGTFESKGKSDFDENFIIIKHIIGMASFLSEDGPELILEHFYIEKYITSYTHNDQGSVRSDVFLNIKVLEDGPELILEYFYIEKYITSYTPLIIVKDAMITCLLLFTTIGILKFNTKMTYPNMIGIFLRIAITATSLASVLRVCGALYQYITKKLERSCLVIDKGRILQTPFNVGCMRGVDYAILILVGISFVPILFMFVWIVRKTIDKYRYYKEKRMDEQVRYVMKLMSDLDNIETSQ